MEIYDMTGRMIYRQEIMENVTSLNTESWPSGAYFWKAIANGKVVEAGKWVKE